MQYIKFFLFAVLAIACVFAAPAEEREKKDVFGYLGYSGLGYAAPSYVAPYVPTAYSAGYVNYPAYSGVYNTFY